jgi:hypothetical protein
MDTVDGRKLRVAWLSVKGLGQWHKSVLPAVPPSHARSARHHGERTTMRRPNRFSIHPLCAALAAAWVVATPAAPPHAPFGSIGFETQAIMRPAATAVSGKQTVGVVTNCADSGPGSLRDVVAGAVDSEIVDVSQLPCSDSTITLTSGEIAVAVPNLSISGMHVLRPTADPDAPSAAVPPRAIIDAGGHSRVFEQTGSGYFYLVNVMLRNGSVDGPGGCLLAQGSVGLIASVVTGCSVHATTFGQGIGGGLLVNGDLILKDSRVSNNSVVTDSFASGGGVAVSGALTMLRSTIADNSATATSGVFGFGGGLYAATSAFITYSTISGNHATDIGGADLIGSEGSPLLVMSTTISGNSSGGTGGIMALQAPLSMASTTIAFNTSTSSTGAGGLTIGNSSTLQSTLIARNTNAAGPSDIGQACGVGSCQLSIGGANNLFMSHTPTVPAGTLSDDPQLMALANYGGPTATHAIASTSPAIDRGNTIGAGNGSPSLDQRWSGYDRVVGAAADIGAFEYGAGPDSIFGDGFEQCIGRLQVECRPEQ